MNGYMLWSFKSRFQLVYIPWKLLEIKQKDLFRPISHSINTRRKCISGHDYARTRHSLLCMAAKLLWPNWPGWATLTLAAVSVLFTALTRLNAQALSVSVQETQETKPEQNSTLDIHRIIRIFLMFRHFSFLNKLIFLGAWDSDRLWFSWAAKAVWGQTSGWDLPPRLLSFRPGHEDAPLSEQGSMCQTLHKSGCSAAQITQQ